MRIGTGVLVAGLLAQAAGPAQAKVDAAQAKELGGGRLTAFGAERAGNADGSIPAYTGGLTAENAGISAGTDAQHAPDPYASEKPLYVVSSGNLGRYRSLLSAGTAAILAKYPDFHLDVYPTHRSAAYPSYVLDNTMRNATTAELTGTVEGDGVTGAYGGVPFPIPQNGYEVLWNDYLHWSCVAYVSPREASFLVDSSGHITLTNDTDVYNEFPYFDPGRSSTPDGYYQKYYVYNTAPAEIDGSSDIIEYPLNYGSSDQLIYFYTVGTRRVRLAPEFKYDTPIAQDGGALLYDEIDMFTGRPDRFAFRLLGKRELIVPYNDFTLSRTDRPISDLLLPNHPNPDAIRWEKHRVWVLDATLKPGRRHIYSRRTFYIDEDTWIILASDSYDHADQLYRIGFKFEYPVYGSNAYPGNNSERTCS